MNEKHNIASSVSFIGGEHVLVALTFHALLAGFVLALIVLGDVGQYGFAPPPPLSTKLSRPRVQLIHRDM